MTDSSRKVKEFLQAERLFVSPTAADRRRNRLALAKQLGVGAAAGASAISTSSWGAWIASAPAKFLATVALAATGSGTVAWAVSGTATETERNSVPAAAARQRPVPAAAARQRPPSTERELAKDAITQAAAVPSATDLPESAGLDSPPVTSKPETWNDRESAASTTDASAQPAARTDDTLSAQASLLAASRTAMRSGNPGQALALLDQNTGLLSAGALSEELAATRIFALCQLGRRSEADQSASSFVRRFPGSPLGARVKPACANVQSEQWGSAR